MDKFLNRFLKAFFFVGFIAIVVAGLAASLPRHRQASGLRAERERILRRIEEKKREIEEIKQKQQRFNSDREFVETLARQNRRVFPGELVFVFDD